MDDGKSNVLFMWNVSNVKNMSNMFQNAMKFNQSLNNWDVSNVIYMEDMFRGTRFKAMGNVD